MTPRDKEALDRIIECIGAIDAYVERVGVDWPTDGMAVDAIAKRIEEIGEVAKRVTPEALSTIPGVSWRGIKGIREVIANDYEEVDIEILAGVVRDDLPGLRTAVRQRVA
jgi:uncharacterized protein with HEPN domain